MNNTVWSFRPLQNNKDFMASMHEKEALILAWPDLGDLQHADSNTIKEKLDEFFPDYTPTKIGRMRATLETFVQKMQEGDHVLIPYKNQVHIAQVSGQYEYVGGDEPQIRKVSFINTIPAKACPHRFAPTILAPMYIDSASFEALLHWERDSDLSVTQRYGRRTRNMPPMNIIEKSDQDSKMIDASYPLRRDLSVTLRIPSDITQQEAIRLADFIRTVYFED